MSLGDISGMGGVQKVFVNTVNAFVKRHEVSVWQHVNNIGISESLDNRVEGNIRKFEDEYAIPTLSHDFGGISYINKFALLLKVILDCFTLRWKYRKEKFDIVLAHDITSILHILIFRSKRRIIFLHTERFLRYQYIRLFIKFISKIFNLEFIAPTDSIVGQMKELGIHVFKVKTPVYNKVQVESLKKNKGNLIRNDLKLVYIGRISPMKKLDVLIRMLSKTGKNVTLDVYGKPFNEEQRCFMDELLTMIGDFNLESRVRFCGFTSDPESVFSEADASVLLSDGEAIPLGGLESFYSGTPVITNRVAGVSELIGEDEVRGVFVELSNNLSLSEAIPRLRRINALECQEYVKLFTIEEFGELEFFKS
jgi:glycosyltransferase involved in cell wall biosynthesis